MKFDRIDWSRAFFKTYYEKRSFGHLLVNFNRIWILHISMYFYYTCYNSPKIYLINGLESQAMTWSAVALGGAVSTLIMIFATLWEFSYIPATWNNTSHLMRRFGFLLVTLGLTCGPTFYIAIAESKGSGGSLTLILGIVQFFISVTATVLFATMPSGRMFGDRVAGKSRKYLASQTFTASYPSLTATSRFASCLLWILVFGCKFTESYFFLTLSIKDSIQVMVGMKIQGCNDKLFGNALCRNQAAFTLTIMYIMDLVLFFLDTYLWYIIWNTVFSIGRSFMLGLSIWTPWQDIFTRLPKRIYAKLLATTDMSVQYKPKVGSSMCTIAGHELSNILAFVRFLFRRFGTLSSFPCTVNICCRLIMSRSFSTIKSMKADDEVFAHLPSLSLRTIRATRATSSLMAARRSVVFRSSHSPSLLISRSPCPLMPCPHSRF
jgi:1,3-beta-glucan synthase